MKILLVVLTMLFNFQSATLYETYDNIAVFEAADGILWEVYADEEPAAGEYELMFVGDTVVQFAQK